MTLKGVNDEQRGKLYKRFQAIVERTGEGKSLDFDFVMNKLQIIHDGVDLFDPHKFFQNREGLWRSDAFVRQILSVAKKTERIQLPEHVSCFVLPKNMNDAEVRKGLGDNHVFSATEGCAVITGMISRQPNGENGDLINDGKANIFYVRGKDDEVFTVDVDWNAGGRNWVVSANQFGSYPWFAGRRGFSHNSIFGS
jgi:hypothetical protein